MRIVYVVPMLAPYAVPRYKALASMPDTEVHVIIEQDTNKERAGWTFQQIEGVHMHLMSEKLEKRYVQSNKADKYHTDYTRMISYGLRKKIKEINPDVVLVCNSTQILMLSGKRNYKLGVVVEDTLRAQESRNKVKRIIKKIMLKKADFYMPFTSDAVSFLIANGINGPFMRSSWSMDTEFFTDLNDDEKIIFKMKHGIDAKTNYILVANLIPRKGICQFLDGWVTMSKQFQEESKLFILGDGELHEQIKERILNDRITNVELLGCKSYKEVSHYLQCGEVFVLPTLEDLCSLAVLEAMASGLAVLTTIYNGAKDFVKSGENGFIFDPLQVKDIVDTLQKIEESDLRKMGLRSKEIIQNYSSLNVIKKLRQDLETIF